MTVRHEADRSNPQAEIPPNQKERMTTETKQRQNIERPSQPLLDAVHATGTPIVGGIPQ